MLCEHADHGGTFVPLGGVTDPCSTAVSLAVRVGAMGCSNSKPGFASFDDDAAVAAPAGQPQARGGGGRRFSEVHSGVKRRFSLENRSLPPKPRDAVRYPYEMSATEKIDMEQLFSLFDADGSGRITHAELRAGMVKMGFCCAEAEARAMVDQLDLARGKKGGADGELDFKEFVRGVLNADSLLRTRLYPS